MRFGRTIAVALGLMLVAPSFEQSSHRVRGYTRKDGTYVQPHRRTNPDSTRSNNWSTRGNVNPYTGRAGTQDPYAPTTSSRSSASYSTYDTNLYDGSPE